MTNGFIVIAQKNDKIDANMLNEHQRSPGTDNNTVPHQPHDATYTA